MAEMNQKTGKQHKLTIDNRQRLVATGVLKVDYCSGELVAVQTDLGQLHIKGSSLHIENLSAETGELLVSGTTDAISYTRSGAGDSFFRKLFK